MSFQLLECFSVKLYGNAERMFHSSLFTEICQELALRKNLNIAFVTRTYFRAGSQPYERHISSIAFLTLRAPVAVLLRIVCAFRVSWMPDFHGMYSVVLPISVWVHATAVGTDPPLNSLSCVRSSCKAAGHPAATAPGTPT